MSRMDGLVPRPPDGMRPGQLGVVILGRVIIGDIAVTLVDLAIRNLIQVEETAGTQQPGRQKRNWSLVPLRKALRADQSDSLLGYEHALIDALAQGDSENSTSSLASRMPGILDRTRHEILHDAVRRGWLRHVHHDQRTAEGDQAAARIHSFQRQLRQFCTDQGEQALTGSLLPYAMHFGLVRDDDQPLARFAHDWVREFSVLPGWHTPPPKAPDPLSEPVPKSDEGFHGLMGYYPAM
jgi:hypothetical protein